MDIWTVASTLFLSLILGATIGLEREVNEKKFVGKHDQFSAIAGIRTFSFIAILGAITGFLNQQFLGLSILIGSAFFLLLIVHYFLVAKTTKETGITTEIGMILCFVIGLLLALQLFPIQIIFALTIVIVLLLSQKARIKNTVDIIQEHELNAFVSFALIAIVILPFLPNTTYAIADIPGISAFLDNLGIGLQKLLTLDLLNPFKLWLIVALITGINFIGYVLERTLGSKTGWLIASGIGGFVSSTSTVQSLARESKKKQKVNHLVAAAIFSNLVSFISTAILIGALNPSLLIKLFPLILFMIIASAIMTIYFLKSKEIGKKENDTITHSDQKQIIDLHGALKFTILYLIINIVSKISLVFFGNNAFLATTGIGALIGLNLVMINTAQLAGTTIDFFLAGLAFIIANAVNLFGKSTYSFFQGKKCFTLKFFMSTLIIIFASLLGLFFV